MASRDALIETMYFKMPDQEEDSKEEESSEDTTEDLEDHPYAWQFIIL